MIRIAFYSTLIGVLLADISGDIIWSRGAIAMFGVPIVLLVLDRLLVFVLATAFGRAAAVAPQRMVPIVQLFCSAVLLGPVNSTVAYVASTGSFAWPPLWAGVSLMFFQAGCYYASDLARIHPDVEENMITLPRFFLANAPKSSWVFWAQLECIADAYIVLLITVICGVLPPAALFTLAIIFPIWDYFKRCRSLMEQPFAEWNDIALIELHHKIDWLCSLYTMLLALGLCFDKLHYLFFA
ncbi:MAG: hypothetical protein IKM70_03940 [Firmicutes bacterium]|nr:hypothetical protein [Bacillota bacterium]